jgi:hypothetical protein
MGLVAIFAHFQNNFVVKRNISFFYVNHDCGFRQESVKETLSSFAGIYKNSGIGSVQTTVKKYKQT